MTDIDALLAEAKEAISQWLDCRDEENARLTTRLIDALTTEREKVAALEAEVKRLREVARELAVELNRIADVTERWPDSLVSQVNEIARAAHTEVRGKE